MTREPVPTSTDGERREAGAGSPTAGQAKLWRAGRTSWSVAGILVLVAAVSASGGLEQVEDFLADDPLGIGLTGVADIVDAVGEQLGEIGELAPQALKAAVVAFEFVAGLLILLVVLLF